MADEACNVFFAMKNFKNLQIIKCMIQISFTFKLEHVCIFNYCIMVKCIFVHIFIVMIWLALSQSIGLLFFLIYFLFIYLFLFIFYWFLFIYLFIYFIFFWGGGGGGGGMHCSGIQMSLIYFFTNITISILFHHDNYNFYWDIYVQCYSFFNNRFRLSETG